MLAQSECNSEATLDLGGSLKKRETVARGNGFSGLALFGNAIQCPLLNSAETAARDCQSNNPHRVNSASTGGRLRG